MSRQSVGFFLIMSKGDIVMASNDMQVLMYKILKYLYECMKLGKEARLEDFSYNSNKNFMI